MIFRQLFDTDSSTYTYLIADKAGGEALIVDPVLERVGQYIQLIEKLDLQLVIALDTHIHADHVTGIGKLAHETECVSAIGEQAKAECASIRFKEGEKLKAGQLDAIIIALPFEEPGVVTLPLYDEPFVAVLPSSHPWTQKDSIRIRDMAKENLLLLGEGHCFRDQVLDACPECKGANISDDAFNQTIEGSSIETIRHMVVSGIGLTVLPCTAAGTDKYARRLLQIKRLKNPEPKRCVALAWRASFPRPKAIEVLRKAIVASQLSCVKYRK